MTVKLRRLGLTEFEISPIGQGVMQFAGGQGAFKAVHGAISQQEMGEIIQEGWAAGTNWFDTAEMYGGGRSEEGLAKALKKNGIEVDDVFIATKWWPLFRTARNIKKSVIDRQRYLNPYQIGLFQVHQPISFSSPEAEMNAMADLVERGLIASVGVSNFNAIHMRRAQVALNNRGFNLASNQVKYSLLNRKIETNGILEVAKELGITIIAWGPLDSGLVTGKFHNNPESLESRPFYRRRVLKSKVAESSSLVHTLGEIAAAHGVTCAQVALNWLNNFMGDNVVAIPGASKPQHAKENAGAMDFVLTDAELSQIDDLTRQFR